MKAETMLSLLLFLAALLCAFMYWTEMNQPDPDSYRVVFYVLLTVCFFCGGLGGIITEDEDYGE